VAAKQGLRESISEANPLIAKRESFAEKAASKRQNACLKCHNAVTRGGGIKFSAVARNRF
jgi:hypothetical protein